MLGNKYIIIHDIPNLSNSQMTMYADDNNNNPKKLSLISNPKFLNISKHSDHLNQKMQQKSLL